MYGKHFQSCYTGSMYGAGAVVFAVWGYAIAHTIKARVELNPAMLAATLGADVESVQKAIDYLCQPDPNSRSKEHDGRRLIREGQFQYFLPTHEKYRALRNDDDRREYNRVKKAEERARKSGQTVSKRLSMTVSDSQRLSKMSAHTETETETKTEPQQQRPGAGAAIPSVEEVIAFGAKYAGDLARGTPGPIPKEFCIAYHEAKEKQQTWTNRNGLLVKWQLEIVGSGWWRDQWQKYQGQAEPQKPRRLTLSDFA